MPEFRQRNDIEAQRSPMRETSPQVSGSRTEPFLGNQIDSTPAQSFNDSKRRQSEIQRYEMNMTTDGKRDGNISHPKKTTSQIEVQLVRDDITNELYKPLSFTMVLKRKKEMLYVPLDFENGLTINALVDSGAYVSAIVQTELDRIKQQAPPTSSRSTTLPIFKYKSQMAC